MIFLGFIIFSIFMLDLNTENSFYENSEEIIVHPDDYYLKKLENLIGSPLLTECMGNLSYSTFLGGTSSDIG